MAVLRRSVVSFLFAPPLVLGTMWGSLGCGESTESADPPPIGDGMPRDIFPDTLASVVEFVPAGELTLVAGQMATLMVQVTPPGSHTVRFALLGQTQMCF